MLGVHKLSPTLRAVGVMSAVAVVAGGVTFAALTSNTAVLADSTIDSATASLKVWDGTTWNTTAPGFHITHLVPGTGVDEPLYLNNDGDVNMTVAAHVPTLPAAPSYGYGFSGFNNLTVTITNEDSTCTTANPAVTNMAALNAGNVPLPCSLAAGAAGNNSVTDHAGNYLVHFDINPAAVTGSQAGVGTFDIDLTGTQTS